MERGPPAGRDSGLYLHVPFCDGKCGYCAFYSVRFAPRLADRYLDALEREAALALARHGPDAPAPLLPPETAYIGGGTPSLLDPDRLARLGRLVRRLAGGRPPAEWTVEVNPGSLTADGAAALAAMGVTRVSIGAQAFDDAVLRRLGRRHAAADTARAMALLRTAGVSNLGLDLLAAVPGVSDAAWRATLQRALDLEPAHLSVYGLTAEEGTLLHADAAGGRIALPTDDDQLARLDAAETLLTAAGFERYEISNYARPGFACRHHLACWRGADYLGLGPAAASHAGLQRWTNRPDLDAWLAALDAGQTPPRETETLTPARERLDRMVFGLRMAEGIADALAADRRAELEALEADGLVRHRAGRWTLTPRGRALADYVAVALL